jgi:beta-1,2-mannosidase
MKALSPQPSPARRRGSIGCALALVLCGAAVTRAADGLPAWAWGPFVKQDRPVLEPNPAATFRCPVTDKVVHWEAQNVYNPAAVVKDDQVWLLYRADDEPRPTGWGRTCRIGLAVSRDGRQFTRCAQPVIFPENDAWKSYEWEGGCEDIHIIEDDAGVYYVNYTAWSGTTDSIGVATSTDLQHWTKHGPAFATAYGGKFVAGSRTGAVVCRREGHRLIAAKIQGKYWMYWRIGAYLATSENLIDWTPVVDEHEQLISLLPPRPGRFDSGCAESGAIAILTSQGILHFYNGLNQARDQGGDGDLVAGWSGLGQALFAADQPARLLDRLERPFLRAEYPWELQGFTPPAVVANSLVFFHDQWLLYYGAADRRIGLAVYQPAK